MSENTIKVSIGGMISVAPSESNIYDCCLTALDLLEDRKIDEAALALQGLWLGVGVYPPVMTSSNVEAGYLLLVLGWLTSQIGSANQVANSQEAARDMLTQASEVFLELSEMDRWSQSRRELAVCYWRNGAFGEARIVATDALERTVNSVDVRRTAKLLVTLINIEISEENYSEALSYLNQAVELHELDYQLEADIKFHKALVLRRLAEIENNPAYMEEAAQHYERANELYGILGSFVQRACVRTNMAFIYFKIGRYELALDVIQSALDYYLCEGMRSYSASAYDTKAQILLAQGHLAEAEIAGIAAVKCLQEGQEYALLADTLMTLAVIYSRSRAELKAYRTFLDAFRIASSVGDSRRAGLACLVCCEEIGSQLSMSEHIALLQEANMRLTANSANDIPARLKEAAFKSLLKVSLNEEQQIAQALIRSMPVKKTPLSPLPLPGEPRNWKGFSLEAAVHQFEADIIKEALLAGGGVSRAAQLLGLSHQNLSVKLKRRFSALAPSRQRKSRGDASRKLKPEAESVGSPSPHVSLPD